MITAHFATNKEGFEALGKVLPTVNQGLDILIPIQDVRDAFAKEGFKEVGFESIGEYVFEGFKKWRSTIEDADWAKYFFVTYEQKHLDYYLLVFDK